MLLFLLHHQCYRFLHHDVPSVPNFYTLLLSLLPLLSQYKPIHSFLWSCSSPSDTLVQRRSSIFNVSIQQRQTDFPAGIRPTCLALYCTYSSSYVPWQNQSIHCVFGKIVQRIEMQVWGLYAACKEQMIAAVNWFHKVDQEEAVIVWFCFWSVSTRVHS